MAAHGEWTHARASRRAARDGRLIVELALSERRADPGVSSTPARGGRRHDAPEPERHRTDHRRQRLKRIMRANHPTAVLAALLLTAAGTRLVPPSGSVIARERQSSTSATPAVTAISGATVITAGSAPVADAVVIIEAGRISGVGPAATVTVPPNATLVDAKGKFVVPGVADMHNHLRSGSFRAQQNPLTVMTVLLAFGVTTVFNPSLSTAELATLKQATATDTSGLPRFFGTGPIVTVKSDMLGAQVGAPVPESPAEARAAIRSLKAAGVDAIKVARDDISWASSQRTATMSLDVLSALVSAAHDEGLKIYAHAPLLHHAKEVLRAGADGLMHGIIDQPVDQELIDLLIRNRAVYVPTLSLYEDVADVAAWGRRQSSHDERRIVSPIADGFTTPAAVQQFEGFFDNVSFTKQRLAVQRANLKQVFDARVPVVMGTDSGFFGIMMGVSSQIELALMVEAGLTPDAALAAATINAARMIGRDRDIGSIEPGKAADVLILDANPLADIANVRLIHRIVKGGVVHDPAQLLSGSRITGPGAPRN
jgi:imidazolonepropionase-like amidohydrolase